MPTSKELANCIRALSMDAVQKANSGHPGAPLGMADMATVLWRDFLKHNPANPGWADRDRFVLSNGHGSMLIYSLLHLTGYDVTIDDIKDFRQLHSKTPGHPEFGYTPGVEVTTGPLGQGLANATGFAIAEKCLAAEFNRPGHDIIDHFTYVFTGDGCLMEGVSHEACSLAGTMGLGKLIVLYDDNGISIDGEVQDWFSDDTPGRFESYGWQVIAGVDGHDPAAINAAIEKARADLTRPTLICCKTVIGYGSPNKQNTASCHGSPLGDDEIALTRAQLGWDHGPFEIPDELAAAWNGQAAGAKAEADWNRRMEDYRANHSELAAELERRLSGDLPNVFESKMKELVHHLAEEKPTVATRKASQMVLEELTGWLPEMMGGSADLAGSNLTITSHSKPVTRDQGGNYIYYGVREFAMSAIMNGLALHGGFIPYGGTFLVFTEYARNAVRMAALMKQRVVFVYTHDSIALGEDGPTHQAVEQIPSMRLTPNLVTWRPADTVETAVAWESAVTRTDGPTALALSRQNLDHQSRTAEQIADIKRGGYVLCDCDGEPELILMATGSEVGITRAAWQQLTDEGRRARLVAMPSVDVFVAQDDAYRQAVLPDKVRARLAVEAAQPDLWYQLVGLDGDVVGISTFGESAPAGVLLKEFGFTAENVIRRARALLD